MYISLSRHEQSILHRRNPAPVYHDARLGATRERSWVAGGCVRAAPGTHINTVSLITSVSLACQADDGIWFHLASMIERSICAQRVAHGYGERESRSIRVRANLQFAICNCFEMKENFCLFILFSSQEMDTRDGVICRRGDTVGLVFRNESHMWYMYMPVRLVSRNVLL